MHQGRDRQNTAARRASPEHIGIARVMIWVFEDAPKARRTGSFPDRPPHPPVPCWQPRRLQTRIDSADCGGQIPTPIRGGEAGSSSDNFRCHAILNCTQALHSSWNLCSYAGLTTIPPLLRFQVARHSALLLGFRAARGQCSFLGAASDHTIKACPNRLAKRKGYRHLAPGNATAERRSKISPCDDLNSRKAL